jgi:predicted NBD/HSP70 family sugar kinase
MGRSKGTAALTMPQAVRHINAMRTLETLFRAGPMSRASIARQLNLTRSTASSIVADLSKTGLLVECDQPSDDDQTRRTGRPGTIVRLNARHSVFIGADIGVGRIIVVAIDLEAQVVAKRYEAFSFEESSPLDIIQHLTRMVVDVVDQLSSRYIVRGLCVVAPGIVNSKGTVVRVPIMKWRDVPVLRQLKASFPELPLIIAENDANAFAMAEHYLPGSEIPPNAIHIFMDAGVGGALMVGGRLQRGFHGHAGEIGYIAIDKRGFSDTSSPPGSLESFIGRNAILTRHRFHGGKADTFKEFVELLEQKTNATTATIADWAYHFGRGLATLTALVDPRDIIVGGPISILLHWARGSLEASLQAHLMPGQPAPRIIRSKLDLEGPALGGAYLLHKNVMTVNESFTYRGGK